MQTRDGAVVLLVVAMITSCVAAVLLVWSAPTLLGEVLLDAVVIASLRKRMLRIANQHWCVGVIRRTLLPFLVAAIVFSLAGGAIQHVRPGADSIGGVVQAERAEQ